MGKLHRQHQKNDHPNVFQISHEIQKLNHIFHNKLWQYYFWKYLPQIRKEISAYKDPVENQHVQKILDKFVIGIFVLVLGTLWYCTKSFVKPSQYRIIIQDILGNQVNMDGIRTNFNTPKVANSFISEYQNRFIQYRFSLASEMPIIEKKWMLEKFKKIYK